MIPSRSPGWAGRQMNAGVSGWAASRAFASATLSPTTFGTSTSFGLQFAVLLGPWPE